MISRHLSSGNGTLYFCITLRYVFGNVIRGFYNKPQHMLKLQAFRHCLIKISLLLNTIEHSLKDEEGDVDTESELCNH